MLATAPVSLADTASNTTTGADSTNIATTSTSNDTTINQSNTANISNNISIYANTGNNTANKNTGDGVITTGDINGSLTITNSVNSNTANVQPCCESSENNASNEKTGADSYNKSNVWVNNDLTINQNSVMNISNNADVKLNTGGNEADKNTGDGIIRTGDINFSINVSNSGNNNNVGGVDNPDGNNPGGNNPGGNKPGNNSGNVLGVGASLPITGSSLPILQVLLLVAAGLGLRLTESKLRTRTLEI